MLTTPASAIQFDLEPERLFGPLGLHTCPSIVVAVSGGSDSLGLLILLHQWLLRHGRADALRAVTVDHTLRPGSANEARDVAALCAKRNIAHVTAVWDAPKPSTGIASAARTARYRLLVQTARAAGSTIILTGHTQDDQAETVAMRAARGAGIGLAGMAPETLLDGSIWLLRPLLSTSRATLRDFLREQQLSWIDDPSNSNPAAERVRVRSALTPEQKELLLGAATEAGRRRRDLAFRAAKIIATQFEAEPAGVRISPEIFRLADRDAAIHAFRLLICVLGQQQHLPDVARSEALFEGLGVIGFTASLGGCVAAHRRAGVTLRPERRGKAAADQAVITMMFAEKVLRPIIPGFDLPAFSALAALFGARPLPPSPRCDHIAPFP